MKKIGILLATFLLIAMIMLLQPAAALKTDRAPTQYTSSKEFIDYINAPVITQEQKDFAQKTIEASDVFKKYASFERGEATYMWAYPYTKTIHASMVVGSPMSNTYGLLWFDIDNRGVIQNNGFSNWIKYW